MNKKEEFKKFIKNNPMLSKSVSNGKTTWQSLYELYDLYGEDSDVFNEYLNTEKEESDNSFKNIIDTLKEIDMNEVKNNLSSLQKAVSFLETFTTKDTTVAKTILNPKPLENFFDD